MNSTAVVLVLIAAFAHAGWNLAAKRVGAAGALFVWLFQTLSVAIYLPLAVVALVVLESPPRWSWLLAAVVSAALHNTYAIVLQRGYAVGDLSVVYPMARGSGPLLSVFSAVVLLGERPGPLGLAGAAVVVLGVFVIGLGGRSGAGSTLTSARWGVLTGVMVAAFTLWDSFSVNALAVPPLALFCARAVTQSLMLTPYGLRRRAQVADLWRRHRREVLAVAVLGPLASVLVLHAMRLAPVSMVAPARELSIVLGSLVAWRWLGEPDPARRLTGAFIVLTGIVAIAVAG